MEEGRELGESKGHEIGAEVGFYAGFSQVALYSPAAQRLQASSLQCRDLSEKV